VEVAEQMAREHPVNQRILAQALSATALGFQKRAIEQRLCPLVVAPVPTPAWAACLFPDLPESAAGERFADLFFRIVGADQPDAIARAAARDRELKARAAALNRLEIRELRVTGGGNDFRIGLADKARWLGGGVATADGQQFQVNVPTFDVFTVPDPRATEGRLVASRPVRLGKGVLVKDLVLEFRRGRVVDCQASEGADALSAWLDTDEGSRALGELALVGQDSPIARTGLFFNYLLFDENAASHVALGRGVKLCLAGNEIMSSQELQAAGCNQSAIHVDVLFGSPGERVVATRSRVGEVTLLEQGLWVESVPGKVPHSHLYT
jgi:aminopeptidase